MLRFGLLLLAAVRAAFLARTDLVVENLALRHQLSTFVHCGRRPRVGVAESAREIPFHPDERVVAQSGRGLLWDPRQAVAFHERFQIAQSPR